MAKQMTADDILSLVAGLTSRERVRLVRMIIERFPSSDAAIYVAAPPARDEFTSEHDPLSWESDGWENLD
jgi:hypothetical protein